MIPGYCTSRLDKSKFEELKNSTPIVNTASYDRKLNWQIEQIYEIDLKKKEIEWLRGLTQKDANHLIERILLMASLSIFHEDYREADEHINDALYILKKRNRE